MALHEHYLIRYADGSYEHSHLATREDFDSDMIFDAFAELERRRGSPVAMLIPCRTGKDTQA